METQTTTPLRKPSYTELLRWVAGHYDLSEYMILEDTDACEETILQDTATSKDM